MKFFNISRKSSKFCNNLDISYLHSRFCERRQYLCRISRSWTIDLSKTRTRCIPHMSFSKTATLKKQRGSIFWTFQPIYFRIQSGPFFNYLKSFGVSLKKTYWIWVSWTRPEITKMKGFRFPQNQSQKLLVQNEAE